MPNDCSKIRCPFNANTFKDCSMTYECEYYTKQLTNGDMIKAMFPNMKVGFITENQIGVYYVKNAPHTTVFDLDWWNTSYEAKDQTE